MVVVKGWFGIAWQYEICNILHVKTHKLMHLHKKVSSLSRYYASNDTLDIVFPDWSFWGWILSTIFYISFPLRYKQKNHSFFFPLSFLRKDEDYVTVYLKKNLYLTFSHKYILKIIHFFLFLRNPPYVWFRLKNQLIYRFFLPW